MRKPAVELGSKGSRKASAGSAPGSGKPNTDNDNQRIQTVHRQGISRHAPRSCEVAMQMAGQRTVLPTTVITITITRGRQDRGAPHEWAGQAANTDWLVRGSRTAVTARRRGDGSPAGDNGPELTAQRRPPPGIAASLQSGTINIMVNATERLIIKRGSCGLPSQLPEARSSVTLAARDAAPAGSAAQHAAMMPPARIGRMNVQAPKLHSPSPAAQRRTQRAGCLHARRGALPWEPKAARTRTAVRASLGPSPEHGPRSSGLGASGRAVFVQGGGAQATAAGVVAAAALASARLPVAAAGS